MLAKSRNLIHFFGGKWGNEMDKKVRKSVIRRNIEGKFDLTAFSTLLFRPFDIIFALELGVQSTTV
jgi:hypothetical protein